MDKRAPWRVVILKKMVNVVKMAKPGWGEHENTANSSEISPRLILSSNKSSNENVLLINRCLQERTQKPRGTSESTTQSEARQKDSI